MSVGASTDELAAGRRSVQRLVSAPHLLGRMDEQDEAEEADESERHETLDRVIDLLATSLP